MISQRLHHAVCQAIEEDGHCAQEDGHEFEKGCAVHGHGDGVVLRDEGVGTN